MRDKVERQTQYTSYQYVLPVVHLEGAIPKVCVAELLQFVKFFMAAFSSKQLFPQQQTIEN